MIRRILVGLAGTSYTSACIQTAIELADRHRAELTGVAVVNFKRLAYVGGMSLAEESTAKELRRHRVQLSEIRADEAIDEFRHACRSAGVQWHIHREQRSNPLDCLTQQARYHDLVILGLRGAFDYGVIGEAHDEGGVQILRLLSSGVRPILTVGPSYRPIRSAIISYASGRMSSYALSPWSEHMRRLSSYLPTPPIIVVHMTSIQRSPHSRPIPKTVS